MINPTYWMAVADHVRRNVAVEAVAEQLNPPAEAAVQPAAEIQPAAGVQPAVLANDVHIVYVIESAAYGVLCTSCLCQKPERARNERVSVFDTNNE